MWLDINILNNFLRNKNLHCNVDQYNHEWVGEVEQQPFFNRFEITCLGKGDRDGEVDGGQDHHAGDVESQDHVILQISLNIVCSLWIMKNNKSKIS